MKKFFLILAAMSLFATPALAQSGGKKIYINNMDLAAYMIADVELKCVTIKFDSKGNLYIIAPGYSFEAAGGTKDTKTPATDDVDKANKFYLVSFPKPNKVDTGYDVDLHINGKFAKRIFGGNEQEVIEITEHFQKGKNEVSFLSVRRKGFKPVKGVTGTVRYAIARGYEAKGTYVIKDLVWEVTRSTTDAKPNYVDKQSIEVQVQ
ncbi:hypothetical protein KKC22_02375 [Myxococcota bacterium]|jgi:hypothetical protein|nr:hypothetical protein [Myxococcota bacterium]MBU1410341.1 hypothetical protein [Myxococcota bacterium]